MTSLKKIFCSPKFFFAFSLLILFIGYSQNFWGATDYQKYYDHYYSFLREYDIEEYKNVSQSYSTFDRFSESFVIGRLIKSKKDGIFSSGGFVGRYWDIPSPPDGVDEQFFSHAYQYKIYFSDALTNKSGWYGTIYKSQSGGQAFVLSLLDKVMPGSSSFKLKFYYSLMGLLTALATILIIFWFYKEFGAFTGWFLVLCFALFNYPTLYAKNLWWVPWAFYIPFILILYELRKEDVSASKLSYKLIFLLSSLGMFCKIFLNGFEFITTAVVMVSIPLFYYAIKNRWGIKILFYRLAAMGGGVVLSVVVSFILLSLQFVLSGESFVDGLLHIYNSFIARTHGTGAYTNWLVEKSANTPVHSVLIYYLLHPVIFDFSAMGTNVLIKIKYVLGLILGISIIWFILVRKLIQIQRFKKIYALNATVWISSLAALSWFIVFKGHSFVHQQHDPIVWFMPFMFFAAALLGISIQEIYLTIRNKR